MTGRGADRFRRALYSIADVDLLEYLCTKPAGEHRGKTPAPTSRRKGMAAVRSEAILRRAERMEGPLVRQDASCLDKFPRTSSWGISARVVMAPYQDEDERCKSQAGSARGKFHASPA